MPTDIGIKIRAARLAKQMTQEDLAKLIHTSKQNIYKYETGIITNIPLDKLEAIASVLSVDPADLTGWTDDLAADERRLLRSWRAATDQARQFALQLLESNPQEQEAHHA